MEEGVLLKKIVKKFLRYLAPYIRFWDNVLPDKCNGTALDYAS
jgi:hypothetical protein